MGQKGGGAGSGRLLRTAVTIRWPCTIYCLRSHWEIQLQLEICAFSKFVESNRLKSLLYSFAHAACSSDPVAHWGTQAQLEFRQILLMESIMFE